MKVGDVEEYIFLLSDPLPFAALTTPKYDTEVTMKRNLQKDKLIAELKVRNLLFTGNIKALNKPFKEVTPPIPLNIE